MPEPLRARCATVFAPASISNLGPGYDVLGVAIERPGDTARARRRRAPGLRFALRSRGVEVPADPRTNVAAHVAQLMLEELAPPFGVELTLYKRMPVGSGLGSSAASAVAAALAVNLVLPRPLARLDLLRFALEGERLASGAPHADNVAPSLLGGAVLVRSREPLDVVRLPVPRRLQWAIVRPHLVVRTEEARRILPREVPLELAVRQWGNVGGLVLGLVTGDLDLVSRSMDDRIVEPVRASLVPGFAEAKQAALDAGAIGCSLSGSGPAIFALAATPAVARAAAAAMSRALASAAGLASDVYVSCLNHRGARAVRFGESR